VTVKASADERLEVTVSTIALSAVHGSIMSEEFALIVTQSVLVHRCWFFVFKFNALHHLFMREPGAEIEVFQHQSAVGGFRVSSERGRANTYWIVPSSPPCL
jgi:hypothetical protein